MPENDPNRSSMKFEWNTDSPSRRWIMGLALILVGALFLVGNLTGFELHNWWALFILFPAVSSFSQAVDAYQSSGRFDRNALRHTFMGLFFLLFAASFLLDFSFGLIWPVFLILGGLALLFGLW